MEHYTDERWNRVIDINMNPIFTTLHAGARLLRLHRSCRMIVTTSVAAHQCGPAIGAAYPGAMSKVIPIHRESFATTSSAWHYFWYRRPAKLDRR